MKKFRFARLHWVNAATYFINIALKDGLMINLMGRMYIPVPIAMKCGISITKLSYEITKHYHNIVIINNS